MRALQTPGKPRRCKITNSAGFRTGRQLGRVPARWRCLYARGSDANRPANRLLLSVARYQSRCRLPIIQAFDEVQGRSVDTTAQFGRLWAITNTCPIWAPLRLHMTSVRFMASKTRQWALAIGTKWVMNRPAGPSPRSSAICWRNRIERKLAEEVECRTDPFIPIDSGYFCPIPQKGKIRGCRRVQGEPC
jgi:hypothetical protein